MSGNNNASVSGSLTFGDHAVVQMLSKPDYNPYMIYQKVGYWQSIGYFSSLMQGGKNGNPMRIEKAYQRKFEVPRLGDPTNIRSIIGNRVVVGSTLQLTMANAEDTFWSINDIVESSGIMAQVISVNANVITIRPYASVGGVIKTTFASTDFAKYNEIVNLLWNITPNTGTRENNTFSVMPELDEYYIGKYAKVMTVNSDDIYKGNWITELQNNMFQFQGEMLFGRQFFKGYEKRSIGSVGVYNNEYSIQKGFIQQLTAVSQVNNYTGQFTEDVLIDAIKLLNLTNGTSNEEIDLMCILGPEAMATFQTTMSNKYLPYAGKLNTFGGEDVKGLNIQTFTFMNKTIAFVVHPDFGNGSIDSTILPGTTTYASSNWAFIINPNDVMTNEGMKPAITRKAFGNKELTVKFVPGMISEADLVNNSSVTANSLSMNAPILTSNGIAANLFDGISVVYQVDNCEYFTDPLLHVFCRKVA